ncbi:MAG: hypothetical protein R3305_09635, partial [Gammaproteobacteria bacterium]|nr:hypothetical protein [Gammaproteobacteria bacterium]
DQRMLALKRPVPRPVLIVSGALTGTSDTLFLRAAMETLEALSLEVTPMPAGDVGDAAFDDYEFVVIADAAVLDAATETRLTRYIETGGGVLLALGPRSRGLSHVPITGHTFAAASTRLGGTTNYSVGTMDTSHAALSGLDTIRAARFTGYNAIEAEPDDAVLIRLETGDPLLIERGLGNGRLLVYTSSLSREWNDLPVEPVFVPFVAGISDYLLGGAGFTNEAALGSTLALQAMGMSGGNIYDPSGDSVLGLGGAGTDVLLEQIGFYELAGGGRTELVAVNFDARESDLTPADEATLTRWQNLGQAAADGAQANAGAGIEEQVQVPLGYWLLLLLLAAIVVESGIGNWHLRVRRGMAA